MLTSSQVAPAGLNRAEIMTAIKHRNSTLELLTSSSALKQPVPQPSTRAGSNVGTNSLLLVLAVRQANELLKAGR